MSQGLILGPNGMPAAKKNSKNIKEPVVTDDVKDWGLVVARFRRMAMTPLDVNQLIDMYVEEVQEENEDMQGKAVMLNRKARRAAAKKESKNVVVGV